MAEKKRGAPRKYKTAKELREGVEQYFRSISYQRPVIVDTPTGFVDDQGHAEVKRRMLCQGPDNTGAPVTVTEWLEPPSLAGLCLSLSISKETWSNYTHDEKLKSVTERARLMLEEYWQSRLEGKGAHGAQFVLKNNFGWSGVWKDKVEIDQKSVGMTLEEYLERAEQEGKEQCF